MWPGFSAFGAATIAALWAYDGWNNLPMASGELIDAQKNIPRALVLGTLFILVIYGLVNLAYFRVLPFEVLSVAADTTNKSATSIAAKAAQTFLGPQGVIFLSIAFVVSALGAMQGSILTAARVPFAMARENLFFRPLGFVHSKHKTPIVALIAQGAWAIVLALSGTFDQLTDYVVFGGWIFYALCAFSVILLRRKYPDLPRAYRVPGYPVLPILFVIVALLLLANTLYTSPRESGYGLAIILAGIPVYWLFFRKRN
jgi:basic amino acid/polyamine antiporter, APA family